MDASHLSVYTLYSIAPTLCTRCQPRYMPYEFAFLFHALPAGRSALKSFSAPSPAACSTLSAPWCVCV